MNIHINISEDNKSFLWLPPKTGSKHAEVIFNLFSFQYFHCSYDRTRIFESSQFIHHQHSLDLFYGHENYQLICTTRNPFKRLISAYMFSSKHIEISPDGFKQFFKKTWNQDGFDFWLAGCDKLKREPDYYIRLENILDDYLKIPFVKNSDINNLGLIEKLCVKKRNESKRNIDIHECFNQEMVDMVYNKYRSHLEKLGYDYLIL